jgi:selenocysteine-specific elongation factor
MISPHTRHVVMGMAGHIDHGKTAIVKALTGIDTDRLKEEKERGMTTDLGFAFLGDEVAIIDVPGHERFVKTMVAGVTGVDLALLVVAADDGVMPQTREHLEILRLLNIPRGLIAVNKIDIVEAAWVDMVRSDIQQLVKGTFLEESPIYNVSAVTGEGIDELRRAIIREAGMVRRRADKGVFRMPIDRVFTIKGFGTVVAGTIASGSIHLEDTVELLPIGRSLRVRGLQVHDHPVQESVIGLRTAINLQGLEREVVERGNVLGSPGYFRSTSMMDAHLVYLPTAPAPLQHRTRIRVHIGTTEVVARVVILDQEHLKPGREGFVQFHFEQPIVADEGDRFVLRSYSPLQTLGGGTVLDVRPGKHRRFQHDVLDRLQQILKGDPAEHVLQQLQRNLAAPLTAGDIARTAGIPPETCRHHLASLEERSRVVHFEGDTWYATSNTLILRVHVLEALKRFHQENPLRSGLPGVELHSRMRPAIDKRLLAFVLDDLCRDGRIVKHGDHLACEGHAVSLSADQKRLKDLILQKYLAAPLAPPGVKDIAAELGKAAEKVIAYLTESGELIHLEEDLLMHKNGIAEARKRLSVYLHTHRKGTTSELRQHLAMTRKHVVPLLEYLDRIAFTERHEEVRMLKEDL